MRLAAYEREFAARAAHSRLADALPDELRRGPDIAALLPVPVPSVTLHHLSYRAAGHEAGSEKQFDFSRASIADRWQAGSCDMAAALAAPKTTAREAGLRILPVRRPSAATAATAAPA